MRITTFLLIMMTSIAALSNEEDRGEYGSYWFVNGYYQNPDYYGSTPYAAALTVCTSSDSYQCTDMVFDSWVEGSWAKFKKRFADGQLAIVPTIVMYSQCGASSSEVPSCQEGYGQGAEICEDGFPSDVLGYDDACDRRALKQCSDGSYVREDIGICPTLCTDAETCYEFVINETGGCPVGSSEDFSYQDPENFSLSCYDIPLDSPDLADNGGNEDGDPYNDPATPEWAGSNSPTINDTHPDTLTSGIGNELSGYFGNLERVTRDNLDQSQTNTATLEYAIEQNTLSTSNGLNSISNQLNTLDTISNQLSGIAQSVAPGECNPESSNYYACLNTDMGDFPAHSSTGGASTIDEAVTSYKSRIENSELVSSFSGMSDLVDTSNAQCPTFSIDLRDTIIGVVASTSVHCDLMETVESYIGVLMIIIYIWAGFRVFASA